MGWRQHIARGAVSAYTADGQQAWLSSLRESQERGGRAREPGTVLAQAATAKRHSWGA